MSRKRLSALAVALALGGALAADAVAQRRGGDDDNGRRSRADWVLLGEKSVGFRTDRDALRVDRGEDWYRTRGFRRLHLIAKRNDIYLRSVQLVYMNGYEENFPVNEMIREGQDHTIDLRGERKYLRRIEMTYRARPNFDGRAVMEVYGEPTRVARRRDRDDDDRRNWLLLGEKSVGFRTDKDVIRVDHPEDWYRDRGLRRLHLVAEGNDIYLRSVQLVYMNGYEENFPVNEMIREGQDHSIDLRGERKYLRRIEMTYRARLNFDGRARMKVYGEPARFGGGPRGGRDRGDWVELGCQQVAFLGSDRDSIRVGRREGRFKAIRLEAKGNDVEILDLEVVYASGDPDNIRVRSLLREGRRTRPLDLKGRRRSIRRINIAYQKRLNFRGKATVCVEGLQ